MALKIKAMEPGTDLVIVPKEDILAQDIDIIVLIGTGIDIERGREVRVRESTIGKEVGVGDVKKSTEELKRENITKKGTEKETERGQENLIGSENVIEKGNLERRKLGSKKNLEKEKEPNQEGKKVVNGKEKEDKKFVYFMVLRCCYTVEFNPHALIASLISEKSNYLSSIKSLNYAQL